MGRDSIGLTPCLIFSSGGEHARIRFIIQRLLMLAGPNGKKKKKESPVENSKLNQCRLIDPPLSCLLNWGPRALVGLGRAIQTQSR